MGDRVSGELAAAPARWNDRRPLNAATLRDIEHASIRGFVLSCADHLRGRTLDYGAGGQPYRDIVTGAHGQYHPYDRVAHPASCAKTDAGPDDPLSEDWDAILCTQVVQYAVDPLRLLEGFADALGIASGVLVMTGPTNWPEVEPEDLHRHTLHGIVELAKRAGLELVRGERRAVVYADGVELSLGWGIVARPAW